MKFSIIVPVYNLEKYICKCIDSLLDQNLNATEYDILIINDGSTDKTLSVLLPYTKNHSNIILFNLENKGVSNARNFGIEKAKGEYILFVDGDDWLNTNVLNDIYIKLKSNNLDVIRFGYNKIYSAINLNESVSIKNSSSIVNGLDFLRESKTVEFYPWLYSFSIKFIKENNLNFNPSLSFCEDKEFIIRSLSLTNRFKNFDLIVYNYNLGRENAVSTKLSNLKIKSLIEANILIYLFAEEKIINHSNKEYIKKEAIKAIKNSYYIFTTTSLWNKFWVWRKLIKNNPYFNSVKIKGFDKLNILKTNSLVFYLFFYLPRAFYHKIIKKMF